MMRTVELGEYAVKRGGSVNPAKHPEETFELFSIPAYDSDEADILLGSEIGSSKKCVEPGDVLLSRIVPHLRRCWVIGGRGEHRQIASGEWIAFRGDDFHPPYLRHFLLSDPFHAQFMQTVSGVGGSLLRARPAQVYKIKVPLPPLPEQKRIAKILDTATALRAKRRESLAQLDVLQQSTFLEMFGDPVENPRGWEMVQIGDLLKSTNYGSSKKASESLGAFPMLRMNNITYGGTWDFSSLKYVDLDSKEQTKHLVYRGQILFNRTNSKELVGKTAAYRGGEPMAFAGYLIRGIPNERSNAEYLAAFMNTPQSKQRLQNMCKNIVGMANINAKEFQKIPIPAPPRALQDKFARHVQRILTHREINSEQCKVIERLFGSLQQRAFAGML